MRGCEQQAILGPSLYPRVQSRPVSSSSKLVSPPLRRPDSKWQQSRVLGGRKLGPKYVANHAAAAPSTRAPTSAKWRLLLSPYRAFPATFLFLFDFDV